MVRVSKPTLHVQILRELVDLAAQPCPLGELVLCARQIHLLLRLEQLLLDRSLPLRSAAAKDRHIALVHLWARQHKYTRQHGVQSP